MSLPPRHAPHDLHGQTPRRPGTFLANRTGSLSAPPVPRVQPLPFRPPEIDLFRRLFPHLSVPRHDREAFHRPPARRLLYLPTAGLPPRRAGRVGEQGWIAGERVDCVAHYFGFNVEGEVHTHLC